MSDVNEPTEARFAIDRHKHLEIIEAIHTIGQRIFTGQIGSDQEIAEVQKIVDMILTAHHVSPQPSFADGIEAAANIAKHFGGECNMLWNDNVQPHDNMVRRDAAYVVEQRIRALAHNPQASNRPTYRHKKRGTEYVLIGYGRMQEPCGECHLQPGETCDICGVTSSEPPLLGPADPPRSGAAEGNEAEAAAPKPLDAEAMKRPLSASANERSAKP